MKKLHFYFTATFFVFALFTCQSVFSQVKDNLIERLYPSDNQFYVDVTDSLVMELSRPVEAISGNLYLYNQLNFVVDTIPLDGPQVTISGDTMLTIVPTNFLYQHWSYYVLTDQGIFGDDYPGIRDPHAWNFTPGFYSRETMYSEFMDDEYLIFISVPDDYDPNRETSYPAIYFTDGNAPRTYQRVNQNYYEGLTPAAISIGVGYHEGENDNRMRDMSLCAYADDFWSFFLKELIPYIEDQYHIDTTNRTYCGGSLGGSFGFYGFCQYKDQENRTFRNYVCGDPSLFDQDSDGNSFEDYESEMHAGIDSLGINLFITAAESEGNRATVSPMIETLKTRDYKNFGLYTWIIPNTNHGSACSRTTEEGILWALTNPEEDYHHPQPESLADAQQVEYSPVTEASPDTILASEIEALDMVENCYNIHKLALFGNSFQLIYNGLDDRLLNEYIAYDNYLIRPDDQYGHHIYERLFAGFNICNKALAGLPYAPVEPDMQSRLIGEVKFCRALLGFYALNIFKHFPFPENVVDYQDDFELFILHPDRFPSNKRNQLKSFISADLTDAIEVLPVSYTNGEQYRATKGAAYALLGKHCLFTQDWAGAVSAFQHVKDLNRYSLIVPQGNDSADYVNAYLCNFSSVDLKSGKNVYSSEFNSESVFEINFYDQGADVFQEWLPGWGTQGSLYSSWFGPHCWHNVAPDQAFVDQFETVTGHPAHLTRDPRMYATIFREGEHLDNRPGMAYYHVPFNPAEHTLRGKYGLRKYVYPLHYNPWSAWNQNEDVNNWRVIRFSDVLLMYAEALYHLGGNDNLVIGLDMLNQVRSRAGLPAADELTPEAIMHERDVEFGAEAMRFLDLLRWSQLQEPWFDLSTLDNFTVGEDEYLPEISQDIVLSNIQISTESIDTVGHFEISNSFNFSSFTYTLVEEENGGSVDNNAFHIENNVLHLKKDPEYYTQEKYHIYVKAEDDYGESRSAKFILNGNTKTDDDNDDDDEQSVSAGQLTDKDFRVYPNPAIDKLTVSVDISVDRLQYFITNIHGQQVFSGRIQKRRQNIDLRNFKQGIYILKIMYGKNCYVKKFLKY